MLYAKDQPGRMDGTDFDVTSVGLMRPYFDRHRRVERLLTTPSLTYHAPVNMACRAD